MPASRSRNSLFELHAGLEGSILVLELLLQHQQQLVVDGECGSDTWSQCFLESLWSLATGGSLAFAEAIPVGFFSARWRQNQKPLHPCPEPQLPGDPSEIAEAKKRNSKSSKPWLTAYQKDTNHKDAED